MKKQALLIGINEYQILPALKYARQDAEAVANSLKQNYCFSDNEVMLLTDDRPGYFKPSDKYIIQDHLEKLAKQDLDLFIFGFWGHGLFRNGQRYLCPLNVMANRAEHQGLPFDELQELLAKIRSKNTCMILDCCQTIHDRGEAETLTGADQTTLENAARDIVWRRNEQFPDFKSNVAILNSCKEGQSAYEWDARQHGLFTAHLLDAMKKRSNSVMQIASYISSNIEKTALELGKDQTPFYKLEGDIVLPVESKSAPSAPGDVFISYRHCNADLVKPVVEEFKRRGITYFVDWKDIDYGEHYSEVISQSIFACKILLLFWTSEVKGSRDIVKEIKLADRKKKSIIPYKIGDFDADQHDKIIYDLVPLSWYEVLQQTPETIKQLVDKIELMLTGRTPRPTFDNKPPKSEPVPPPPPKPVEEDPFAAFIEEEKRKRLKRIQDLLKEAIGSYNNQEYSKAIVALDVVLKLEPNSVKAKELKSLCQSGLEFQVAEEERKRREAEEAERRRREAQQRAEEQRRAEAERKRREEEARKHDLSVPGDNAGERKTYNVNGVEFAFRWCPAGTFTMGSPTSELGRYSNETQHRVTLTKGFWMMETQVTQKQWKAVMGSNLSNFKGDDLPVEKVSWNDCQEFCKKCTQLGLPVQLPTEAQWEYACRAGTTGAYAGNLADMAWYSSNSGTHPVGTKKPNAWGLYDMHGNVWEWCADWYGDYPSGSVTDPTGPSSGSNRVLRGGCWIIYAPFCRSAYRGNLDPGNRGDGLGFRVVRGQ